MTAVHDWAVGLNFNQTTHCLFLDMSKAFDSIPYNSAPEFLKCLTRRHRPARAWFLKIDPVRIVSMRACVCVCNLVPYLL